MKKNTLWIVAGLLALLLIGVWTARRHSNASAPALSGDLPPSSPPTPAPELAATPAAIDPVPDRVPIQVPSEAAATKPADFGLIRVLVLDKETDQPLEGATVTATHDTTARNRRTEDVEGTRGKAFEAIKTGKDGRVEIEMLPLLDSKVGVGGSRIDAGYEQAAVPALAAGEVREVVLRLPTANDLPFWLKLVEEETRTPIPGAEIKVERNGRSASSLNTDARGLAFHGGRTWMNTKLTIEAERHAAVNLQPVPGHTTAETALLVELPLAATMRVVVKDPTGAAVPNAQVRLTTPGYNLRWDRNASLTLTDSRAGRWSARTDAAGVAVISRLPVRVPIRASLTTPKNWEPAEPFLFEPGETRTVTWTLSTGCALSGVVLDQDGRPVVERSLWICPALGQGSELFRPHPSEGARGTKTDAQGRFRFDDTAPGGWLVGPSAESPAQVDEHDVAPLGQFVRVPAGQNEFEITIRVDRGLFIRGRLDASDGTASKGGYVTAWDPVRSFHGSAQANRENGAFTIGPLMAGRYQVSGMGQPDARSDRIEVDAGTDAVVIRLKAGAKIAGRVVGVNGEPVEGRITCSLHGPAPTTNLNTGIRKGSFELQGLDAGTFDLAVIAADGSVGVLENIAVQSGASRTDLTVTVAPGGSVRLRHEGPERFVGVAILQRGVLITSDGLERGTSQTFRAPTGSVTVRATYREDARTVERVVQVAAGETVDVAFEQGAR